MVFLHLDDGRTHAPGKAGAIGGQVLLIDGQHVYQGAFLDYRAVAMCIGLSQLLTQVQQQDRVDERQRSRAQ